MGEAEQMKELQADSTSVRVAAFARVQKNRALARSAFEVAAILVTVVLAAHAAVTGPIPLRELIVFSLLAVLTAALRLARTEGWIGFEGVVAFPIIVLFHHPGLALLATASGLTVFEAARQLKNRQFSLTSLYYVAQTALSFYLAGRLFTSNVARTALLSAKAPGFFLLLVSYLAVLLMFVTVHRYFAGGDYVAHVGRRAVLYSKSLVLISPIVVSEVLVYPQYGLGGFCIAFLPVLLVSYVMRNETGAAARNVELERRNRELSLLSKSSVRLFSAEGEEATIGHASRLLADLFSMRACAVVSWGSAPDEPGVVYRFGECQPTDQAILKWIEATGYDHSAPRKPIVKPSSLRDFPLSYGDAHQIVGGIQTVEVIYGILVFESEDSTLLEAETRDLFNLVLSQTALSLQDQLLKREMHEKTVMLEKKTDTMSTILDVSHGLIGEVKVTNMFDSIAEAAKRSLTIDAITFALYDEKQDLFIRSDRGLADDSARKRPTSSVAGDRVREYLLEQYHVSSSYVIPSTDVGRRDLDNLFGSGGSSSGDADVIIVPLTTHEKVAGYFAVTRPSDGKQPPLDELQTLEIFANQAVAALQSARQYDEIHRLTIIDALTPAYNRRYFQDALEKEVHRNDRQGRTFALAILDIDYFKSINDTYGHQVGDEILRGLVLRLMNHVRDIDSVARYGGEEFAIILPDVGSDKALATCERLRRLVADEKFRVSNDRELSITISIGVAVYPDDATTSSKLINRADAALYHAKKSGRNQVIQASDATIPVT